PSSMIPTRPSSASLSLACASPSGAAHAAEECVARFDASVARYQEAVKVQKGRETANWQESNAPSCQGRSDSSDMEFASVDDYEQCARDGGKFPEKTVSAMQSQPDDSAARTEQQGASIDKASESMRAVTASVEQNAGSVADVDKAIADAHRGATQGGEVVEQAVAAMTMIQKSSQEITQMIN
ncbi:hypothetical protein OY671_009679, partial [Metschnikowia pulcherrima]